MKFFEGLPQKVDNIKKKAKKAAIGAGIVLASTSSMEAQNIEQSNNDKKVDTTEVNLDPEFYRGKYLKYMEHPSYKLRLAKEMFRDSVIDRKKRKQIDLEYQRRLKRIKTIPIEMIPDVENDADDPSIFSENSLTGPNIKTTPRASSHELAHAGDGDNSYGFDSKADEFISDLQNAEMDSIEVKKYEENHGKFIEILKNYLSQNKDSIKFSLGEHLKDQESATYFMLNQLNDLNSKYFDLQKFYKYFSIKDVNRINNDNRQLIKDLDLFEKKKSEVDDINYRNDYFRKKTEIKARINHLRIRAVEEFGHDLNKEFNINDFPELKNDRQYKELRDELNLSDEEINELSKYTADIGNDDKDSFVG